MERLNGISKKFQIYGELQYSEVCKVGHINETYIALYDQAGRTVRYLLQTINTEVFKNPDHVMENMTRITKHIRDSLRRDKYLDVTRRTLTIVPTRENTPYFRDSDGRCWRTFFFIENAKTYDSVQNVAQAEQAGLAFGEFQSRLVDLGGDRLHETIPDFHNTVKRLDALRKAVEKDSHNRVAEAKKEINFIEKRAEMADVILKGLADGTIPERITHNDTKFNNVMLDTNTQKAMCVVDLDTVMPGSVLYDFGDMVRTTTSSTLEDELDLGRVRCQKEMFKALAKGYLTSTRSFLTEKEKELLTFAGRLVTYTIAIRFLTDFLSGDTYFRVHRPGHNLDRCRTQLKLIESIEKQEKEFKKIIAEL